MAIINNNVQNVKFLRNQTPFGTRDLARQALEDNKGVAADGTALLARYTADNDVKTLVGFVAEVNSTKYVTIIDVEGGSDDVEKLRQEINAKLGNGIGSGASETVTAQLTALSGNPSTSTSAETSVEGAKRYADELKNQMDYSGVTTGDGVYVTNVTQADGIVSATTATLPSVTDTKEAKKVIVSVSEDKGEISIERGSISSSAETMVLTDNADGGVNFEVNIDNDTIIQDANTKKLKVADTALVQYVGDEDTIHISAVDAQNNKTVSSLLTIQKVTTGLSEIVKEEYRLVGASGNTIGAPVQIYKDSHIVSITYITDTGDTHYQNLEYVYIDASGNTQTTYVDMSELVIEAEFASGVTVTDGIAHGVVDPTSETFLTVGADGFKLAGVQDAIDAAVEGLDADESGSTEHITVNVVEENGVITGVNVEEDNIANADDLAELSGKTITAITSTNGSITTSIDDAVGNKSYNIETDASKIKMSGFTSTGALSSITTSSSITEAFGEVEDIIEENERVTAEALTDLDDRIETVSGDVETIKTNYISGVSVNGNAVTVANKVAPISITAATSAATATSTEAIVVDTDANGNITLGIANIDCGFYA